MLLLFFGGGTILTVFLCADIISFSDFIFHVQLRLHKFREELNVLPAPHLLMIVCDKNALFLFLGFPNISLNLIGYVE
jgi:hypothetical protein